MSKFDRKKYNKLCAEFMGFEQYEIENKSNGYFVDFKDGFAPYPRSLGSLEFHTNWNWIVSVIEKIESLDDSKLHYQWKDVDGEDRSNFNGYSVDIEGCECRIWLHLELDPFQLISSATSNNKLDATISAIYNFLCWHKEEK